jgi:hypothetical protein
MFSLVDIVSFVAYGTGFFGILLLVPTFVQLQSSKTKHNGEGMMFAPLLLGFAYFVALFILNCIHETFETAFYFSILCSSMFLYFMTVFYRSGNSQVKQLVWDQVVIFISVTTGLLASMMTMPGHHQKTFTVSSVVSLGFIGNIFPLVYITPKNTVETMDMVASLNNAVSSVLWYVLGYLTNDNVTMFASVVNTFLTSYWLYLVVRPLLLTNKKTVVAKVNRQKKHE